MNKNATLQEQFLSKVLRSGTPLVVFLMNGFQLRGVITGFDNFSVLLQTEGKQQFIYKHAISTMVPAQAMHFGELSQQS